jgi:UDP-3-O-[3-hydroxymyristoyl] glucosamine N-acyltransferase
MQGPFGGLMPYYKREKMVSTNCFRGRVVIKDNVGIGALAQLTGVTGDTIGEGTKIDNQVHVGHDTVIKKCLIASNRYCRLYY